MVFSLPSSVRIVPQSTTLKSFGCRRRVATVRCETGELEVGSPIIVVEAPKMIKTADSVPCLRLNSGLVNPGDVGRIVSRKPKDVWAVRLAVGTYLIDGKYFKPLVLEDN
uniref:Chlororespiratory reduction 42 n=1 Tax=Erodium texanum TaxID=28960 RepID=A0A0F7DHH9_EROTE|nr:chlororespiratory reduction 42 [Erodium texanum]